MVLQVVSELSSNVDAMGNALASCEGKLLQHELPALCQGSPLVTTVAGNDLVLWDVSPRSVHVLGARCGERTVGGVIEEKMNLSTRERR